MVSLYRCRSSSDELRAEFACELPEGLTWRSQVLPRQHGLVIWRNFSKRCAEQMHWGIPSPDGEQRWNVSRMFSDPAFKSGMEWPNRCLIVVDSFALPDGPKGKRTRSWFGLWDRPLFAWAGLWRDVEGAGRCFIGATRYANKLVARVGRSMPVIIDPVDYEKWLYGNLNDVRELWRKPVPDDALWMEQTDELWHSGDVIHEIKARKEFKGQ